MYQKRMNEYYPQVIRAIKEYQAIINAEYPEFEDLSVSKDRVTEDAYLLTMSESRIIQWENILGITPISGSSLDDRRSTIIARIRGKGKLNTALISSIVNAFTGGTANSWIANSCLYVEITPPPGNRQYQFANVEQELWKKVPAHLDLKVSRNYFTWGEVNNKYNTWEEVKNDNNIWEDVYLFIPFT